MQLKNFLIFTGILLFLFSPKIIADSYKSQERWIVVKRGTLYQKFSTIGSLQSRKKTQLGFNLTGRVLRVLVDVGDLIKKGQRLAYLDPVFFKLEVEHRKLDIDIAKSRLDWAKRNIKTASIEMKLAEIVVDEAKLHLDRMEKLWKKPRGESPSIPQQRYDNAVFNYQKSLARVESAKSGLAEAKIRYREYILNIKKAEQILKHHLQNLQETMIKAPYDAVVTKRLVDPGEPVTSMPMTYILEIEDLYFLELVFSLPQRMLSQIKEGTLIEFGLEGVGQKFKGQVEKIYPVVDPQTRTFRCRALVKNADFTLRAGLLAKVNVIVKESANTVIIPKSALRPSSRGYKISILENDKEVLRDIEIGIVTDNKVEVLSGIREGDKVLIRE